jgi:hypothetical protein
LSGYTETALDVGRQEHKDLQTHRIVFVVQGTPLKSTST